MAWVGDMAAVAPLSPHCPPEVFPQQMEGVKLIVNKTLSSHFQVRGHTGTRGAVLGGERGLSPADGLSPQVTHTVHMSTLGLSSYHFNATFVGDRQLSPTEVRPWGGPGTVGGLGVAVRL